MSAFICKFINQSTLTVAICFGLSVAVGLVSGATLSDNLNQSGAYTEIVDSSTFFASSFGTGNYSSLLSAVALQLEVGSMFDPIVSLYSDHNGEPGSALGQLLSPGTVATGNQIVSFGGNQLSLTPNSIYWVVAQAAAGSYEWFYSDTNAGSGLGFQHTYAFSYNAGTSWFTSDVTPMKMSVQDVAATVPEPGSLGLFIAALSIGLGGVLCRRNQLKVGSAGGLSLLALFCAGQVSAFSSPVEFNYTQPTQTVLNPDGGPWVHADLTQMSVETLSDLVVTFPTINFSVGPLRLVHAPLCLNPVGANSANCGQLADPTPITDGDVTQIDGYLQKAENAHLKILLRFAYNYNGSGPDASMNVILADIAKLAPVVAKHKNIIYAMEAGFIGYWGEGHNSTHGNNTPERTRIFMAAEEDAFGPSVTLLNRYPSNILDWEPRGRVTWGIHDDHYTEGATDSHTWMSPNWSRFAYSFNTLQHFGEGRTDQKPFSVEVGGEDPTYQSYEAFDAISRRFHLNALDLTWNTTTVSENGHFPEIVNRVGPAIGLTSASLYSLPQRGLPSTLTLSFVNTGYSRLFTKVPVYLVLTDSAGNRVDDTTFPPIPVPIDLTSIASGGGTESVSVKADFPNDLTSDMHYYLALWIPDPDPTLGIKREYNYLLNNVSVPNQETGLNQLFPFQWRN